VAHPGTIDDGSVGAGIGSSYNPPCRDGAIGAILVEGRHRPPRRNAKGAEHGLDYTGNLGSLRRNGSHELPLRRGL